jgi:ribose 5-phosphate isomerase B
LQVFESRKLKVNQALPAMKIGIAADHGGFLLKEKLKALLEKSHQLTDFGAHQLDTNDDYPDHILPLAQAVAKKRVDRGIALCGSGVGACIVANKLRGVRAALIHETYSAHQGVEHDDMNMICLGARVVGEAHAWEIVSIFLNAAYIGDTRHARRVNKIKNIEKDSL